METTMEKRWDQTVIQHYIDNEIEEGTSLDYKEARALGKSQGKKKEIAKDVSAMANTAGGIIIYGVSEYQEKDKKHLPERIDPVDRTQFSKEWLDQVITHNIQPRIEGLTIHPVDMDTTLNHVVYVVEIPQSTTAHQVTVDKDYRYYERSNFESVRMEDYRIRDVMNRATTPNVSVEFKYRPLSRETHCDLYALEILIKNLGQQVVNHFKLEFSFPGIVSPSGYRINDHIFLKEDNGFLVTYCSTRVLFPQEELDIGREVGLQYKVDDSVWRKARQIIGAGQDLSLHWILYADNMMPKRGKKPFSQLHNF
jgi:hypothetical protein